MAAMKPSNYELEEEIKFGEQESEHETRAVISFNDAWKRELDYREHVMRFLPTPVASKLPSASAQPAAVRREVHNPQILPVPRKFQTVAQDFSYQQHSPMQTLDHQHPQLHTLPKPLPIQCALSQLDQLPQPGRRSQSLQLTLHSSSTQVNPQWCSLCEVPCMNDLNYEQHCQGKKHKVKWEVAFGNSKEFEMKKHKFLWCNECGVPCVNELALSQHLAGKKHAICLVELNAADRAGVL